VAFSAEFNMAYEFKLLRRVEFSDTDLAGIMHFSNFFRFMEAAETAFLRSLGLSVVLSRAGLDVCLPRVHAECDYSAPLHFEDEVLIHLLVERKGERTLTYQFRFIRQNGSPPREVARGRIVAVCAGRKGNGSLKAVPLPALLADKIKAAPAGLLENGLSLVQLQNFRSKRIKASRVRGPAEGLTS
jgi:YbgC/YbaW family acyl-CoA thioester hydrolase